MGRSRSRSNVRPKSKNNGADNLDLEALAERVAEIVIEKLSPKIEKLEKLANKIENLENLVVPKIEQLQQLSEKRNDEITALEERIVCLEELVDSQEQYSRRTSVRISGVKETEGEDVVAEVMNILDPLDIPVQRENINRTHRVGSKMLRDGKPRTKPRQILVQFKDYPSKAAIMKVKKNIDEKLFPDTYISEDLTSKRSKLLYLARQKKKAKKLNDCWSYDGAIVVKDLNNKICRIKNENDLVIF